MLGQFLVQADVAFSIVVRKDWTDTTQQHGNSLVPASESMVQIREYGEVIAMF